MKKNNFYDKQSDLTNAKIKTYKNYIAGYLPKLLMTFNTCVIVDMFCGAGKNGKEKGSPLVLIDGINSILSIEKLKNNKDLKIHILFNDQNKNNIENLEVELSKLSFNREKIIIHIKKEKYEELLPLIIEK